MQHTGHQGRSAPMASHASARPPTCCTKLPTLATNSGAMPAAAPPSSSLQANRGGEIRARNQQQCAAARRSCQASRLLGALWRQNLQQQLSGGPGLTAGT